MFPQMGNTRLLIVPSRGTLVGMSEKPVLVEVDRRGRVSLGRVTRASHDRYLAHEEADGTVVLTPAVVMSELEARFLSNRTLVDRVERNRRDPDRLVRRRRSSQST